MDWSRKKSGVFGTDKRNPKREPIERHTMNTDAWRTYQDRKENDKKKDKSNSKIRTFITKWLPGRKSAKRKNVNKQKDTCKGDVQLVEIRPLTEKSVSKVERKLQDKYDTRPLTGKNTGKAKNKLQDHKEHELSEKRPLTAKSEMKLDNKERYDARPLTGTNVGKAKSKPHGRKEDEISVTRPLTAKSEAKSENKYNFDERPLTGKYAAKTESKQQVYIEVEPSVRRHLTNTIETKHGTKVTEVDEVKVADRLHWQTHYDMKPPSRPEITAAAGPTYISVPNGLPNLGNTCYFNAALQCLFWCKGFSSQMNNKPMGKVSERLMEVFHYLNGENEQLDSRQRSLLCGSRNKNNGREVLKRLLNALRQRNDQFIGYDQQDSFEMLNTILSSLQEEYKGKNFGTSFLDEEFGGTFVTSYVHDQCQKVDLVFQNFTSISVPVTQSKTTLMHSFSTTVQTTNRGSTIIQVGSSNARESAQTDALCLSTSRSGETGIIRGLKKVTSVETMAADILPCRKCNDKAFGLISKRLTIIAIPNILILHISRFSQSGRSLYKDQRMVSYPYFLNISDVCSSAIELFGIDSTRMQYELCGVVCHSGTMNSGHYIACVNTSPYEGQPTVKYNPRDKSKTIEEHLSQKIRGLNSDGGYSRVTDCNNNMDHSWYRISDSDVRNIHSPLNIQDAYILFYRLLQM